MHACATMNGQTNARNPANRIGPLAGKAAWLGGLLAAAVNAGAAVAYAPGDTWVLDGATDWTNAATFAGLGTVQDLGGPDTNTVWTMLEYTDVHAQTRPLDPFTSPVLTTSYYNDPTYGPYRRVPHNTPYQKQEAWVSSTAMAIGQKSSWGAQLMPAIVWRSPVQGTVRLTATLVHTGIYMNVAAYGVFLNDAASGKYRQLAKGVLAGALSRMGTGTNTLDVSVSLNAGDRLIYVLRCYMPYDGYEYAFTSGAGSYPLRWVHHSGLTVTYASTDVDNRPARPAAWRRADVWWRADVHGGNSGADTRHLAYDRRDPDAPSRYYAYLSTNQNMDLSGTTGLTSGETLTNAVLTRFGIGHGSRNGGLSDTFIFCQVNAGVRSRPAVWLFQPPVPGRYVISGTLSRLANDIGTTRVWLGTARVSDWGAYPTVTDVRGLWYGSGSDALSSLSVRTTLDSTDSAIYLTLSGYQAGGERWCYLDDKELTITRLPSGSVLLVK